MLVYFLKKYDTTECVKNNLLHLRAVILRLCLLSLVEILSISICQPLPFLTQEACLVSLVKLKHDRWGIQNV